MEIESITPKITKKQTAENLGYSDDSTIKRYRDLLHKPSFQKNKSTKRKKLSSQDGSITVEGGNCGIEDEIFLVKI